MFLILSELKLKECPLMLLSFDNFNARAKYPERASKTCCQGLVELGFLIFGTLFFNHIFIQSGINRFLDQSPPPITFPALAVQSLILKFLFSIKVL